MPFDVSSVIFVGVLNVPSLVPLVNVPPVHHAPVAPLLAQVPEEADVAPVLAENTAVLKLNRLSELAVEFTT